MNINSCENTQISGVNIGSNINSSIIFIETPDQSICFPEGLESFLKGSTKGDLLLKCRNNILNNSSHRDLVAIVVEYFLNKFGTLKR